MKNLEVVIPAYNEEERVKHVIEVLKKSLLVDKVIVVDDGSKDATFEEARRAGADVILRHSENRGKGVALQSGIEKVKGSVFLIVDADLRNFKEEHIDILVSTYKNNSETVLVNGIIDRGIANQITKDLEKLITGIRLIKRAVWEAVEKEKINKGYEIDYLIYEKAKKQGSVETKILPGLKTYKKTKKIGILKGTFIQTGVFLKIIYNTLKRKLGDIFRL